MHGEHQSYKTALDYAMLMACYGRSINNYCMLRAENLQEAERLMLAVEESVWIGVRKLEREGP